MISQTEPLVARLEREIGQGRHGRPDDRFMTVRQLAREFRVSLATAHRVMTRLKEAGLLIADSTNPAKIGPLAVRAAGEGDRNGPHRLGLIVSTITSPFFSRLCRQIQEAAARAGYQVLMASSEYDFDRERRLIQGYLQIGVEGLLICPGLADRCRELYRDLLGQGIRLGFVSRRVAGVEADFVVVHDFAGAALVAGHLLSMGRKDFGYVGFGPRLKQDLRLDGFRSALAGFGIQLHSEAIAYGDGRDIVHGYRAAAQLMKSSRRPGAVFAFNDLLAIGVLRYCQDHRIAVPGKVAIVGFDNLPESRVTSPPLTTIDYPVESIARLAVGGMLERINSTLTRPPNRILLEPHLVVRRSTDPRARQTDQWTDGTDRASLEVPTGRK